MKLSPVFLLALAALAPVAQASDYLVLSGASYHFAHRDEYRGDNPGIGWERDIAESSWNYAAGYYRNSYDRDTFYAGGKWMPLAWGHAKAGAFIGVASGYWTPVVAIPMVSLSYERVGVNIAALPTIRNYTGYVAIQLTLKVN